MQIIIDSRENKLIRALESDYLKKECNHLIFDIDQLDVGDIMYQDGSQVVCLVERKTLEDYVNSITDKRSKNQSLRIQQLRKQFPQMIVIYLIEGAFVPKDHKFYNGITRDALYTSLIHRVTRDHYTLYRSCDIYDTALIITKLYDQLSQIVSSPSEQDHEKIEYLKTIKLAKKDNMTPENCYLCQLSQIPGSSIDFAQAIAKQYPNMVSLINAYQQVPISQRDQLLAELIVPVANHKVRRLGNVLSQRIYQYLFGTQLVQPQPPSQPPPTSKIKIQIKK
uniref:ERCC4 domain-containing protein n=1 Tax=viral metagenome TaxID=1070528 RepID=A0A6C0BK07_9ZZZZ